MYAESELDAEVNFVPKIEKLYGYPWKICKDCIHESVCPLWYQCDAIAKWRNYHDDDLDYDNSL